MSRRLLTAGLTLTVLLGALAWAGRSAAKPPDLPLMDKNVLAPETPPPPVEASSPSQPTGPATDAPFFVRLRPSTRRMMASCLLFGVHPLLGLAPTDEYVGFDEDDAPPLPAVFLDPTVRVEEAPSGSLIFGVGVSSDAGLTGSIEMTPPAATGALRCSAVLKLSLRLIPHRTDQPEPQPEDKSERCTGFHLEQPTDGDAVAPEPIPVAPKEAPPDDATRSVCPWMLQQPCGPDRQAILFADAELSQDVRRHLEMLRDARTLLDQAREFGHAGRVFEALECLGLAHAICPGSRIDDAVQETAAYLFAPLYWGSPENDSGADEAPEPALILSDCPHLRKSEEAQEREIEMKLQQPASLHFDGAPLRQVLDDLRSWQNMNIYVDMAALEAEEVSLDRPVTMTFENISLKSALSLILKQAHLAYVIKDGVLQVTTERGARGKMQRVVYAVGDLLDVDLDWPGMPAESDKKSPEETLTKLIITAISPQQWCGNGGPGIIDIHPLTHSLVVYQTADVQEQVVDLLNALRRAKDARAGEDKEIRPCLHESREDAEPAPSPESVPLEPCLPPVDPDMPVALDQLYPETCPSAPAQGSFEFGFGLDGSVQMFGQFRRGGAIWHVYYGHGLEVWASPDGGASVEKKTQSDDPGD